MHLLYQLDIDHLYLTIVENVDLPPLYELVFSLMHTFFTILSTKLIYHSPSNSPVSPLVLIYDHNPRFNPNWDKQSP